MNIKNDFIEHIDCSKKLFSSEDLDFYPYAYRGPDKFLGTLCEYVLYISESAGEEFIGRITLRMGESKALFYLGHIGYTILPKYRGNNYAYKACKSLIPFMKNIGFKSLVITNDIDNIPSRKICIKLNSNLESIVTVPNYYQKKFEMKANKCRYILDIKP